MIRLQVTVEGEPTWGTLVDIIPAPEDGAYYLLVDVDGKQRRLAWEDPGQIDVAAAEAELAEKRAAAAGAQAKMRAAEERAAAARRRVDAALQRRQRDALLLPADGATTPGGAVPGTTDPGPAQ